jgi:hypothetical protein
MFVVTHLNGNFVRIIFCCCVILLAACNNQNPPVINAPPDENQPTIAPVIQNNQPTVFFASAHPDDIELFMGQHASDMVAQHDTHKTVFIVLTAGDAGYANTMEQGHRISYWLARQRAHANAVSFWLNTPVTMAYQYIDIDGIRVYRSVLNDQIVLYNLRLPDGGGKGEGYPRTQHTSLMKLNAHRIKSLKTIDHGTTYELAQLYDVLNKIIHIEVDAATEMEFNLTENNPMINVGDHADHMAASDIMQAVINQLDHHQCIRENKYSTYMNRHKPISMSALNYQQHLAMWHVLSNTLTSYRYNPVLDAGHMGWLGRQYVTTQLRTGTCDDTSAFNQLLEPVAPIQTNQDDSMLLNSVHDDF